jgi:hypothetical protein
VAVEPLLEELLEVEALVGVATGHWLLWAMPEMQILVAGAGGGGYNFNGAGTGGSGVIILKYLSKPNYQIFQSSGTWTCPTGITEVEYLVVAGGGGGGGANRLAVVVLVGLEQAQDFLSPLELPTQLTVGAGGNGAC